MSRWFVVYTQAKAEERALWHLRNQGFTCFLPRLRKIRRHARQSRMMIEPLFPRYIFVKFDPAATQWRCINGTRGVVALITSDMAPVPVPEGKIESLIESADKDGATSLAALGALSEGIKVRVMSGAFAEQIGEATAIFANGRDRIQVLLNMLGKKVSVQLPAYAVERA